MTSPMPNPFVTNAEPSGFVLDERAFMAALLSNSVVADRAAARQPLQGRSSLNLAAAPSGAAALSNSNPPSAPAAGNVTVAGLAIAPKRTASAAVTTNLDLNAKNIATLLALAESSTAPADHSSISET